MLKKSVLVLACFLSLSIGAFAEQEEAVRNSKNFSLQFEPGDVLLGSYNVTLEIKAGQKVSFFIPMFYAHHDAALIKGGLFWNSSLGVSMGVKFFLTGDVFTSAVYLAAESGAFVIYPFETGTYHLFGGRSTYSEVEKSPMWLVSTAFRGGYQHVGEEGWVVDASMGLIMYDVIPNPDVRLNFGWAF